MHRDQCGHAAPRLVLAADQMAGRLRGDHRHVDRSGRHDFAEVNVEPVREHQRLAWAECGGDRVFVDGTLLLIGNEHHDHIARSRGVGDGAHLEPVARRARRGWTSRPQSDDHVGATIA